jgi:DNA-binding NtrC family response regulator
LALPKILIVDDEVLIRRVFLRMFKGDPYTTFDAANSDEALTLFTVHHPIDVLITDLQLAGEMSGAQVAKELLRRQPSMRVIIISGDIPAAVKGLEAGSYWMLAKPFTTAEVKSLVRFVLGEAG